MKVRALYPLAAAAGLWMPSIGFAQQPAKLPVAATNPNQVLADNVASHLRASGVTAPIPVTTIIVTVPIVTKLCRTMYFYIQRHNNELNYRIAQAYRPHR